MKEPYEILQSMKNDKTQAKNKVNNERKLSKVLKMIETMLKKVLTE